MTPNRDEQMARLSLTLDPKERANLMAEHERWERRRRAMKRGDDGSPVTPEQVEAAMDSAIDGLDDAAKAIEREIVSLGRALYESECGPLHFAPVECSACRVKLTSQNHFAGHMCLRCAEEDEALKDFEAARQRLIAENKAALAKPSLLRRFLSLFGRGRGKK